MYHIECGLLDLTPHHITSDRINARKLENNIFMCVCVCASFYSSQFTIHGWGGGSLNSKQYFHIATNNINNNIIIMNEYRNIYIILYIDVYMNRSISINIKIHIYHAFRLPMNLVYV